MKNDENEWKKTMKHDEKERKKQLLEHDGTQTWIITFIKRQVIFQTQLSWVPC